VFFVHATIINNSMNKIYFAGSIRAGRGDAHIYKELVRLLSKYGKVLTEHVGDPGLAESGEVGKTEEFIFERDVKWIAEADVLVAEVTQPSLGVGYEIGVAERLGKRVLCLYRVQEGKKLSAMIMGNKKLTVESYGDISAAEVIVAKFFK